MGARGVAELESPWPSPSAPYHPLPHARSVPSASCTMVEPALVLADRTPVSPGTRNGVRCCLTAFAGSPRPPSVLLPHMRTVPSASTMIELPSRATSTAASIPFTCTGFIRLSVVPSQIPPSLVPPQPHTVPSSFNTRAESPSNARRLTPATPSTFVGTLMQSFGAVCPHIHTVPSESTAAETQSLAMICVTPRRPGTGTGTSDRLFVPVPSSHSSLSPHARTVPSPLSNSTCVTPTDASTTSRTPGSACGLLTPG